MVGTFALQTMPTYPTVGKNYRNEIIQGLL